MSKDLGSNTVSQLLQEQIAKYQKTEQLLEHSIQKNLQFVDSCHDAFVAIDQNRLITDWNPGAEQLFGWQRTEAIGHALFELIIPERNRKTYIKGLKEGLKHFMVKEALGSSATKFRILGFNKSGQEFPVELTIFPIDCEGQLTFGAFLHVDFDQTQEQKLYRLLDLAPDAMVVINQQGKIVALNSNTEHIFGYTKEELIDQSIEKLIPDRPHDAHPEPRIKFFRDPHVISAGARLELNALRKDGTDFPIEISLSPLETEQGILVSSAIRDITERKQSEHTMKRLAAIVDSSEDAIIGKSTDGIITSWNSSAERILGYTATEALGKPISMLIPLDKVDEELAILKRVMCGERIEHYDSKRCRQDGQIIDVSVSVSAVNDIAGQIIRTSTILRDITKNKLAEALIKEQSKLLAQKIRDLETLLYVVSHDLKEPLRAIQIFSEMIYKRYASHIDEKGQDFLQRIIRAAKRMDHLLSDILLLSRVRNIENPNKEVDFRTIINTVLKRLDTTIAETKATIDVVEPLPKLKVNGIWATEAVYNLVLNALRYTEKGEKPEIEIAQCSPSDGVGIVVRDRGPGVAPEHQERIFKLFQRAVGREIEGTGAGLAIVQQIAERHDGNAWVRARDGGGSEFIITFGKGDGGDIGDIEANE
jgi:PAS domain S-box-containing protein